MSHICRCGFKLTAEVREFTQVQVLRQSVHPIKFAIFKTISQSFLFIFFRSGDIKICTKKLSSQYLVV